MSRLLLTRPTLLGEWVRLALDENLLTGIW